VSIMSAEVNTRSFPLSMTDEGARVRIHAHRAGRALGARLTELGLNVGCEVRVVQRQGGGFLLARGEGRIAIGGGMASKILVVPG
jgi:ferrous iron transport protein A